MIKSGILVYFLPSTAGRKPDGTGNDFGVYYA
jgi:hypothetical protein